MFPRVSVRACVRVCMRVHVCVCVARVLLLLAGGVGRPVRTCSQVLVRWSLQKGFVPLPKSVTPSRIEENFDVFDPEFVLSEKEMARLSALDADLHTGWNPTNVK
jgi:hypothetical protein